MAKRIASNSRDTSKIAVTGGLNNEQFCQSPPAQRTNCQTPQYAACIDNNAMYICNDSFYNFNGSDEKH